MAELSDDRPQTGLATELQKRYPPAACPPVELDLVRVLLELNARVVDVIDGYRATKNLGRLLLHELGEVAHRAHLGELVDGAVLAVGRRVVDDELEALERFSER